MKEVCKLCGEPKEAISNRLVKSGDAEPVPVCDNCWRSLEPKPRWWPHAHPLLAYGADDD